MLLQLLLLQWTPLNSIARRDRPHITNEWKQEFSAPTTAFKDATNVEDQDIWQESAKCEEQQAANAFFQRKKKNKK
jgi:hypothetical protein